MQRHLAGLSAAVFCLTSMIPAHAALNIPDTPLQTSVSAEPNLMMIIDDSGSMHFEIMPDDHLRTAWQWGCLSWNKWGNCTSQGWIGGSSYYVFPRAANVYGPSDYTNAVATVDWSNPYARLARSPQINTVYYNPSVTYTPWSHSDGRLYPNANPACALHNPTKVGTGDSFCRNLTANNSNFNGNSWIACTSSSNCTPDITSRTFWPATYFRYNGGDIWSTSNYTQITIQANTASYSGDGRSSRTDCSNGVCTYQQEIQNFANWYTYYRSRILTARAGIGRAFAAQDDGLRVGFGTINKGNTTVDGVSDTSTIVRGVRQFKGTDRDNFFSDLYTRDIPAQGTPLRTALRNAGNYYSRTDDRGPWSTTPGQSGGSDLACRLSYTILMTDGYWNDSFSDSNIDNYDNTTGPLITGPNNQSYRYQPSSPFRDNHSNTLADVAMYYWNRDLREDIPNAVPSSAKNPAFWQHMVTFGVGLGVNGSIRPADAYAAIGDPTKTITWPDPNSTEPAKLDDLLHAAINGRGEFFSAQNPTEFATALSGMLKEIIERKSSSSSVTLTGPRLTSNSKVFVPSFNTSGWVGELAAYNLTAGSFSSTPVWKASEKIPAHASRKIFTVTGNNKREFLWGNLSTADRGAIVSETTLNFLRGDRSQETANGGTLRTRSSLLGDIVHSSPVFQADQQTVYVGANDGMLHAFNSETGVERFAYIPSPMLAKMRQLSETSYQHKYFVDGELTIADKSETALDSSYLIGTMGAGAKGLFALNITNPAAFTANNIAWEYINESDNELGYMMGKPIYARLNGGTRALIVGNGYNSSSGKAALYIFNLESGALIRKFIASDVTDNGMATPGVVDTNGDGFVDHVYAGDLKGNVWKYDLRSTNPSGWSQSLFFTAIGPDNKAQPITTQITSAVNYLTDDANAGKRFIFFGTGSYFRAEDINDKSVQTWYGLIDTDPTASNNAISGRGQLTPRSVRSSMTADGKPARSFSVATTGADGKVTDMTNKRGWYLDWIDPGDSKLGERMVTPSIMYRLTEPTLLGSSVTPEADDPCQPGGTGYVNAINAFTGASLKTSFFVFSNSTGTGVVGSLDLNIGMPSQPSLISTGGNDGRLIVGGSGDAGAGSPIGLGAGGMPPKVNLGDLGGRVYWREITGGIK